MKNVVILYCVEKKTREVMKLYNETLFLEVSYIHEQFEVCQLSRGMNQYYYIFR
jgi:hypothetical protein